MTKKQKYDFIIATNNEHKLGEIRAVLSSVGCGARSLRESGIEADPEENGATFSRNARIKAEAVFKAAGGRFAVLADDSGLCVDFLGGRPGVHTARYAGEHGDSEKNMDKLLAELKDVPQNERSARFVSCVCALLPSGEELRATGFVEGYIGFEREGAGGFGYDPVFRLPNKVGIATLSDERKNAISHRGRALRKLAFKLRGIKRIKGYRP
ncbi:MAG: RdgB/HAM1 family non-canonical purine NTP pyrophosphatase [Oscillospiraceae bacterium]|nr:RdgB/HAM1 family non-canonical purine NTP pyrophosphatase [Oscillospiraceae bacterium]